LQPETKLSDDGVRDLDGLDPGIVVEVHAISKVEIKPFLRRVLQAEAGFLVSEARLSILSL
jgi:hypothetical protein